MTFHRLRHDLEPDVSPGNTAIFSMDMRSSSGIAPEFLLVVARAGFPISCASAACAADSGDRKEYRIRGADGRYSRPPSPAREGRRRSGCRAHCLTAARWPPLSRLPSRSCWPCREIAGKVLPFRDHLVHGRLEALAACRPWLRRAGDPASSSILPDMIIAYGFAMFLPAIYRRRAMRGLRHRLTLADAQPGCESQATDETRAEIGQDVAELVGRPPRRRTAAAPSTPLHREPSTSTSVNFTSG